jgi:hypothetical protein
MKNPSHVFFKFKWLKVLASKEEVLGGELKVPSLEAIGL